MNDSRLPSRKSDRVAAQMVLYPVGESVMDHRRSVLWMDDLLVDRPGSS